VTPNRYWLGFNLVQGIGPVKVRALIDQFGSVEAAWQASAADLQHSGLDKRSLQNLLEARTSLDLDLEAARLEQSGVQALTWDDSGYPARLREIADPPPVLYARGSLLPADDFAVAMVGTRVATAYGKEVARVLASGLARNGITVVSGLARGIDLVAHQAALDAGGRTIAVLGCGVDIVYPPEARRVSEEIVQHGALLSDYPLGTRVDAKNFPPRNRIISGMSLGTVVVEADFSSGALITASFALDQGRDVFAVPGSIHSKASHGTNRLIQQGAKLVTSVEDILEELRLEQAVQQQQTRANVPEDETERTVWNALSQEAVHVDELRRTLDLPVSTISATLILMELKGLARHVGSMNYIRIE
jgi:DNA processing protein